MLPVYSYNPNNNLNSYYNSNVNSNNNGNNNGKNNGKNIEKNRENTNGNNNENYENISGNNDVIDETNTAKNILSVLLLFILWGSCFAIFLDPVYVGKFNVIFFFF